MFRLRAVYNNIYFPNKSVKSRFNIEGFEAVNRAQAAQQIVHRNINSKSSVVANGSKYYQTATTTTTAICERELTLENTFDDDMFWLLNTPVYRLHFVSISLFTNCIITSSRTYTQITFSMRLPDDSCYINGTNNDDDDTQKICVYLLLVMCVCVCFVVYAPCLPCPFVVKSMSEWRCGTAIAFLCVFFFASIKI